MEELNAFLGRAMKATYAGGGEEVESQRPKFRELEYEEGDWYYRDSYAGHTQSWGQEVVWCKGKPLWTQLYGGGAAPEYQNDKEFGHKISAFLKKALLTGEKEKVFQPRGQNNFSEKEWEYTVEWVGDIKKFSGHEEILFKGNVVFTHNFFGGLFILPE